MTKSLQFTRPKNVFIMLSQVLKCIHFQLVPSSSFQVQVALGLRHAAAANQRSGPSSCQRHGTGGALASRGANEHGMLRWAYVKCVLLTVIYCYFDVFFCFGRRQLRVFIACSAMIYCTGVAQYSSQAPEQTNFAIVSWFHLGIAAKIIEWYGLYNICAGCTDPSSPN